MSTADHAAHVARRQAAAVKLAAEVTATDLTSATVTRVAKAVTAQTPMTTTQIAPGAFRARLKYEGTGDNAARLLKQAAAWFIQNGYDASVTRERSPRSHGTDAWLLTVIDSPRREREAAEQTQRRHATMARELGYATVEDYLAAPGRAELIADSELSGYPRTETTVEQWGPDAVAVTREYDAEAGPTPERAPALAPTVDDDRRALAAGLSFVGMHGGVRTFQVSRGRSSGQRIGRVTRITESLGGGEWVRWAAYREDGSRVGYAEGRLAAGQLLLAEADRREAVRHAAELEAATGLSVDGDPL